MNHLKQVSGLWPKPPPLKHQQPQKAMNL